MGIEYKHEQYSEFYPIWKKARDFFSGEETVKKCGVEYLPRLGGQDNSEYDAYKTRAVCAEWVAKILNTNVGQMFRKDPVVEWTGDKLFLDDCDMNGTSLSEFSRSVQREVQLVGRVGIHVDYADRPYLKKYNAESIINWQVDDKGQLTRVVLCGKVAEYDPIDPYMPKTKNVYIDHYLRDGVYTVDEYEENRDGKIAQINDPELQPMINGMRLDYVPFVIIGKSGSGASVESSPLRGIVNLNAAHYRLTADFYNGLHFCGVPTVIARGWDNNTAFPMGGCAAFGENGGADIMQAQADTGLQQELKHIEERIGALGNSMIASQGRYVASGETSKNQSNSEYATLADIANAFGSAMTQVLRIARHWEGAVDSKDYIAFNTDYDPQPVVIDDVVKLSGVLSSDGISEEVFFYQMQLREMYPKDWTFEKEKSSRDSSKKERVKSARKMFEAEGNTDPNEDKENTDEQNRLSGQK